MTTLATTPKQDLTGYSDSELSLWFNNDEGLYNALRHAARYNNSDMLVQCADENFIYTPAQLDELMEDFNSEVATENDI